MRRKTSRGSTGADARSAILGAAVALVRGGRGSLITTDEVAQRAECAKGLVHYHFKSKDQLLAAAAEKLWQERADSWGAALTSVSPRASIGDAWKTLLKESSDGTSAASAALGLRTEKLVVQSINNGRVAFARGLTGALDKLLAQLGLEPSVPISALGALLVAVIEGIGLQLGSGAAPDEMEQAWSAFWAGLLSLTEPRGT